MKIPSLFHPVSLWPPASCSFSWEMFLKNSNIHGVSPPPLGSPNTITPEKVITALSHCAGAVLRRQALSPPSKHVSFIILCYDKRNSTDLKKIDIYDTGSSPYSFFVLDKWEKRVAPAPITAVITPIIATRIELSSPPCFWVGSAVTRPQ